MQRLLIQEVCQTRLYEDGEGGVKRKYCTGTQGNLVVTAVYYRDGDDGFSNIHSTKTQQIVYFKYVYFIVCQLCLNKVLKKI